MTAADDLAVFRRHGGRLAAARAAFPDAPAPWLDLSTGINPRPWRGRRARAADLSRLPDPQELRALEAAAAAAFGADPDCVVATAGAEAALRLAPQLTGARSAAVVSPTYGGHAAAWGAAGAEVTEVARENAPASPADVLVLVNPNNPDGAASDAAALADGRRWLVVDESFVETAAGLSVAGAGLPRTLVLRSFGKFYGLPGVRLGFLVAPPSVAAAARRLLGDWPVSADAIALGRAAYADREWARRTTERLRRDADRLDRLLVRHGFQVVGGATLFRLARSPDAPRRFARLLRAGVLSRPFEHDRTLLRFGLPGPADWGRLAAALDASGGRL